MSENRNTPVVIVESVQNTERSGFYSILTTLVSIVVLGIVAYAAWWLFTKVMVFLGVGYMAVIAFFEFKNLIKFEGYKLKETSLNAAIDEMVANTTKPSENGGAGLNKEQATGFAYAIMVAVVLGYFTHNALTTLLMYGYGKTHAGHDVAILGLILTIAYGLRTIVFVKDVYEMFKHRDEVKNPGKVVFFLETLGSKTRSLLALVFMAALLAANYGLYFWF
jgi:hypothetical protein